MDDIEELVNFEDDEVEDELTIIDDDTAKLVLSSTKITSPIMSNYEKIGIISKRVQSLDNGYKSTIEEEIKKIKKELSSFFGNSLSSIILYDSYAIGKEMQ